MGLYQGSRLVAFVVASAGRDAGSPPSPGPTTSDRRREDTGPASRIRKQLSLRLPSYSVPDAVVLVPALPLTRHGECRTRLGHFWVWRF